jgi:hypothetical protein
MSSVSIVGKLRQSIEHSANDLRQNSALARLVKQGRITPRAIALYLESLRYLFSYSEPHLLQAAERADALGDVRLGDYFREKAAEEKGHDGWASADLARLPAASSAGVEPAHAIRELVSLQRALISQHPMCYAAYVLWAEYLTTLLGDEWLAALAAAGYGRDQLSAAAKHLDADREHVLRGFADIEALWQGKPEPSIVLAAVERAARVFRAFCDEICSEAERAA